MAPPDTRHMVRQTRAAGFPTAGSDGRELTVEAMGPDDRARLAEFASRSPHMICQCPGRPRGLAEGPAARLGVTTPAGELVALACVEGAEESSEGRLSVSVHPGYQHHVAVGALIAAAAQGARDLGWRRLTTCVPRDPHDAMEWFREAGLRTLSSLCVGGVTEVVLDLE